MKIAHICLACFYVEGWGYQENILPKKHVELGNNVIVFTSDYAFTNKSETVLKKENEYVNKYGVQVKVLTRSKGFFSRYGKYNNVYSELTNYKPDIIFVHGGQFLSLGEIVKYKKRNKEVRLFIDQHADFYNTPIITLKKKILHYLVFGHYMRKAVKHTEKFWGVTPWRCQYLHEVYKIPNNKIGLLVMGGDEEYMDFSNKMTIRQIIRKQHYIKESDFLIVTGGKIDRTKNFHLLMESVNNIENKDVKLLVFGQPNNEMEEKIKSLCSKKCIYIGWIESEKVYDYFFAADLVVFPGTHSVLWEQACASKVPCLFKRWKGMEHVNNGGNAEFFDEISEDGIRKKIESLINTPAYFKMKEIAESKNTDIFLYSNIASKSIEVVKKNEI